MKTKESSSKIDQLEESIQCKSSNKMYIFQIFRFSFLSFFWLLFFFSCFYNQVVGWLVGRLNARLVLSVYSYAKLVNKRRAQCCQDIFISISTKSTSSNSKCKYFTTLSDIN